MEILSFIIPTFAGLLIIYKALEALDKIDFIQKNGIKRKGTIIKIREEKTDNNSGDIEDGSTVGSSINYYFTVRFNDKNGREVVKEIEFPVTKKPTRIPPFQQTIFYFRDENRKPHVVFENTKTINYYISLLFGFLILGFVAYSYDGQLDLILNKLEKLFK